MKFRRLAYLAYYTRKMDWQKLMHFMRFTKQQSGVGYLRQALLVTRDSLRYNISPLEFYQFGFVDMPERRNCEWAGTGTMYEFQMHANPFPYRDVLNDKRAFHSAYGAFFRHEVHSRDEIVREPALARRLLSENEGLVFKSATGQCGIGVELKPTSELDPESLVQWMIAKGHDVVETVIKQHSALQALSSAGVNTVRIFTLITRDGEYRVLGCRLRISVHTFVDNMAAGNLAAPVDEQSGVVTGPGVYSDIACAPEVVHPVTKVQIVGFAIPYWEETLDLVRQASLLNPRNRSIGWDVAITPDGPGLIEGNHDWCKLVWQLPVRMGLKSMLLENGRYA